MDTKASVRWSFTVRPGARIKLVNSAAKQRQDPERDFVRVPDLPEHCELTSYRRELGAWSDWRPQMVSTDHFRQELLAQLGRAATRGRMDILINSEELCRSTTRDGSGPGSCCDAMQGEFKLGDTLLLDRINGAGMTVRYLLPRAN